MSEFIIDRGERGGLAILGGMFGFGQFETWQERMDEVVQLMRELSTYTDPQVMVNAYGDKVGRYIPSTGYLGLSRRGLEWPEYRITRSSTWENDVDPWLERTTGKAKGP